MGPGSGLTKLSSFPVDEAYTAICPARSRSVICIHDVSGYPLHSYRHKVPPTGPYSLEGSKPILTSHRRE